MMQQPVENWEHTLVDYVELEIGGQRIDKHYGHWMEVWSELTEQTSDGEWLDVLFKVTIRQYRFSAHIKWSGSGGVVNEVEKLDALLFHYNFGFAETQVLLFHYCSSIPRS